MVRALRVTAHAAACAIAVCAFVACAHVVPPAPADTNLPAYWDLVARLDLGRAARAAKSNDEARLTEALTRVTGGETARATVLLDSLTRRPSTDSTVRRVSLVVLAGLLHTEHLWSELRALPTVPGIRRDSADLAGVEAWAAAFALVRAPRARFRSDSAIFPIVLSPLGVPMLPVEINGRRFLFWIDTGASLTMISADVARVAGIAPLSADSLEAVTAVGRLRVLPAVIRALRVGPLDWSDAPAMIVGSREFTVADSAAAGHISRVQIDGIVGWDVLRQLDVRIDHPRGVLTMRKPGEEHLDPSRRNLFWLGYPLVRAKTADGAALNLGLDTGLQQTFVTRVLAALAGASPVPVERRRIAVIGGDSTVRAEMLQEVRLKIGDSEVLIRRVTVHAPANAGFVMLDGVLGSDIGAEGVVRIDATNGVYRVTPL